MTAAVAVQSVSKRFGALTALDEVSLNIEPGEFFALLGPNGAGKTTLISILAGLTRATSGEVRILGHDVVSDYRNSRCKLGVVPQELVFDPFFTVRETLRLQSGYFGLPRNDDWIDELLSELALADKADTNMRKLSGGMKRRVMVAQALVHKPPVIVLDEPTAGVDVELRQSLWQFVQSLNRQGHTILLTTHYLEEAETLCNRIAMLKQGRLVALEEKHRLLARGAGRRVVLTLAEGQCLPAELAAISRAAGRNEHIFDIPDVGAVDVLLARFRAAELHYLDIEIHKPDLEQVFLSVMQEPS